MSATELGEHLDQEETQVEKFLSGKKLYLTGLESEQESELVDWITEAGGDIVSIEEKNEIDYLITGRASEKLSCEQYQKKLFTLHTACTGF